MQLKSLLMHRYGQNSLIWIICIDPLNGLSSGTCINRET